MIEEEKVKINGENGGFRDFLCRPVANGGYPSRILVFGFFNCGQKKGGGSLRNSEGQRDFALLRESKHQVLNPVIFSTTLYAI